jgi:hypothetical protein
MMSKMNYEVFAEAMVNIKASTPTQDWRKTVSKIALICERDNPRFDRTRFLLACGYGSE